MTYPFDHCFVRELPGDPKVDNYPRPVEGACYSLVSPGWVQKPETIAYSAEMADRLGLSDEFCHSDAFAELLCGNRLPEGTQPYASCYGGHQFGSWAGQLGDGRAINLGEIIDKAGIRQTLQLKGAGLTPYSRRGDGRAVLRSSLREFLCSEAMHHLGVPTTRALSLVATGEDVIRDMFYDGHPKAEPGAIVCRVAPSFIRFGHFELIAARGDTALLKQLADFTIRHHFPSLERGSPLVYGQWFTEICRKTAEMIVQWQRVGFVHGVMNTDNMSILGLTLDYGPYGWLEEYNLDWTPNTTDASLRRYRFGNQPQIALWNLERLAEAIHGLVNDVQAIENGLAVYKTCFENGFETMMAGKIGITRFDPDHDGRLIRELLRLLQAEKTDMTLFYRNLALIRKDQDSIEPLAPLMPAFYDPETLTPTYRQAMNGWLQDYICRIRKQEVNDITRKQTMDRINPKYVLRNYLAALAIEKAEEKDYAMTHELLVLLSNPYADQPEKELFAARHPDWANTKPGCSMLSCSS